MPHDKERTYTLYANALLSDGELLFWWTGRDKCSVDSFYKDFYYAGLNMTDYCKTHTMTVEHFSKTVTEKTNNDFFDKTAPDWYSQFDYSPDFAGRKPHDKEMEQEVRNSHERTTRKKAQIQ